jgi:hypothetical protein
MADLQEYIVTLYNFDELDAFYDDMETPGGNLYIPDRLVEVAHRRPISKNTHYMLTAEEAGLIKKDTRVIDVISVSEIPNNTPCWTTPSQNFSKRWGMNPADPVYNWGLKRCTIKQQIPHWYPDDSAENQIGTVSCGLSGKHVDVIIVDGQFNPNHPSFSVNNDGTGGSRVVHYNWFSLDSVVKPNGNNLTEYDYSQDVNAGHGSHVAGIVAGNENGWARDANIYNICPYYTNPNLNSFLGFLGYMWDYIRAFHASKPINPVTGVKNPTIVNCSYGAGSTFPYDTVTGAVTQINYRGTLIGDGINPVTFEQGLIAGLQILGGQVFIPQIYYYDMADIEQAIADGIIVVGAAGNSGLKIDKPGGVDYNNYVRATEFGIAKNFYFNRGHTPAASPNAICVGAVDLSAPQAVIAVGSEVKYGGSNCGPRVSVFAPGASIMSSWNLYNPNSSSFMMRNPRNPVYGNGYDSGTSMASPQVCGVLACVLEMYPTMTPAEALDYITHHAIADQLTDIPRDAISFGGDLQGAPNLYLYVYPERPTTNTVYPKVNYKPRPATGKVYPRFKTRVYK